MRISYLIIFIIPFIGIGQKTETTTHIFWNPERPISEADYQGINDNERYQTYCDTFNLCTVASTGLFAVLDIPKKKRKRGLLIEKPYFAAAFDKTTSYILRKDSLGIQKQQLVFDIYELGARFARQELQELQDSTGAYGTYLIFFKTVEVKANSLIKSLVDGFTREVYIENVPSAYLGWRMEIDELLAETSPFATKDEDRLRFISNTPIDDQYEEAKRVVGNLMNE